MSRAAKERRLFRRHHSARPEDSRHRVDGYVRGRGPKEAQEKLRRDVEELAKRWGVRLTKGEA